MPNLYTQHNSLLIPATLADGGTVEAWVYVMNNIPPQAKVIASGDWKNREDGRHHSRNLPEKV